MKIALIDQRATLTMNRGDAIIHPFTARKGLPFPKGSGQKPSDVRMDSREQGNFPALFLTQNGSSVAGYTCGSITQLPTMRGCYLTSL